uniref:Uncharacterized protein n=1 Tax=Amphimedon queenslandica TaxID=400682 RepID=A0A1X7UDS5_AMPQE
MHEWDGGKCFFHDLTECGKCKKSDITCQVLHMKLHVKPLFAKSKQTIHEELGCCHTSITESSHNVLLLIRTKNLSLQMLHCYVSTSLGLIQSYMFWMYVHKGPAYHWLLDLFDRMGLPRFDGMAEALKASWFKSVLKVKLHDVKCKRRRARKIHRQSEQVACKLWVEQNNVTHMVRKRLNHLIKDKIERLVIQKEGKLIFDDSDDDDESLLSSSDGNDSSILNSSGIDSDLKEFIIISVKCTCSIEKSSHQRSCPLNPKKRGKSPDVEYIKSEHAMPLLVIGKTPSTDWMTSAALLI